MSTIPINSGALPGGFCPTTYQQIVDQFAAVMSATLPTAGGGITISAAKPSSTSDIWFRIDSLGRFLGIYIFGQGAWLSPHSLVPGLTQWWFSALPDFTTFDGGDANTLGPASGPMWQQALDGNGNLIAASFPAAAGTLPSGSVLAIGGTGGEETHLLTGAESGVDQKHRHGLGRSGSGSNTWIENGGILTPGTPAAILGAGSANTVADVTQVGNGNLQTDVPSPQETTVPHNNMPPYIVGYLLQRTTRLFFSII